MGRALALSSNIVLTSLLCACAHTSTSPVSFPPVDASPTLAFPTTHPDPHGLTPSASASPSSPAPIPTASATPIPWQELGVIPTVSDTARAIYQRGLEMGNNPHAFSKIGDCESTPTWFLGDFDRHPPRYRLGEYANLQEAIDYFAGSFIRTSAAAGRGWNAASVLTPLWADPAQCHPGETPLDCELRLHRPSLAFVMLGTNDHWHRDAFEDSLRRILERLIEQGVVPILATKASNLEGDGSLNATIARLALDYDLPLWNFWLAVQDLPAHGLLEDGAHITWNYNHFDDPRALRAGWPVRNLTALQALDAVWRGLTSPASAP